MYGQYIATVTRRAFQPTARITDVMQILAASAAPAVAKFLGFPVPTPEDTLAYIGAAAIAFVALRLFFVAPYQVWRTQAGEIGTLKLELSKPEQIEMRRMARMRARARVKMAQMLGSLHLEFQLGRVDGKKSLRATKETVRLLARIDGGPAFGYGTSLLHASLLRASDLEDEEAMRDAVNALSGLVRDLQAFLHGRITAEALALRLHQGIGLETQP
jgi:hypothetical protein